MIKVYAGVSVLAIAALLGGTAWYVSSRSSADPYADCRQSAIAGGPGAIGGPFTLIDQTGATVTDKDVITKPSLVYFGYTFCPDVCPMDNARNVEAIDILEELGHDVTPVFITVDPDRDTPAVMAEFAEIMHPRMIALTGTPDQVKSASQAYRTYYKAQEKKDDFYLVDHSTFTYLVLPEKGFVEFFRREVTPDQMARQVACFIDKG
ncbi:MAG: SCO family protein [Gemmobacter sp.]|nr:SCO family protein [Gemmobacter sp.]